VHFQEIFATLYRNLGIDVDSTRLTDFAGRPQFLSERQPIRELSPGPRQGRSRSTFG
jgi:hypothetical protein